MQALFKHLRSRPRFYAALAAGVVVAVALPASLRPVTRALLGWNATLWVYLAAMGALMRSVDHDRFRNVAAVHSEGAVMVMLGAVGAVAASLVAIVAELAAVQAAPDAQSWQHLALALSTLVGSWLLLPTLFALSYASVYYRHGHTGTGLDFPGTEGAPDYADFMYFSVTIAATSQTSDVAVTTRAMRRWVLAHSLLSFAFNTMLLALAINIGASLL